MKRLSVLLLLCICSVDVFFKVHMCRITGRYSGGCKVHITGRYSGGCKGEIHLFVDVCHLIYPFYVQVKARISVREKRYSVHKLGRERLGSFEGRPTGSNSVDRLSSISTTSFKSDSDLSEVESTIHPPSDDSTLPPTQDDSTSVSPGMK